MTNPTCTLIITMTGTSKAAMKEKLLAIAKEFDTPYGKPCQGTCSQHNVETKVETPIWNGKLA
jgi:hypothetical protein